MLISAEKLLADVEAPNGRAALLAASARGHGAVADPAHPGHEPVEPSARGRSLRGRDAGAVVAAARAQRRVRRAAVAGRKMLVLSRFVALSFSLTPKASLL